MNKEELLNISVSFYRYLKSAVAVPANIGQVLAAIRGSYYETQVRNIRGLIAQGKKAEADELKGNLPAVTFCATFQGRRLSGLCQHYNSLMVIDIDKLEGDEVQRVQECLEESAVVACYWKSPSGKGWKGLVPLNYLHQKENMDVVDMHHWAFIKLEEFFKTKYAITLDGSGKDITRLCFMSWCPELRLKDNFSLFDVDLDEMLEYYKHQNKSGGGKQMVRQSSGEPIQWNMVDGQKQDDRLGTPYDRTNLERIYKFLSSHGLSITSTYEDWVKVAFAIAHTFHSVYGRKMFLKFCELDGPGHNAARSERLIYDAYKTGGKRSDFSTIMYLAQRKGFIK